MLSPLRRQRSDQQGHQQEEYGYDAFGRRVWVRTDRRCDVGLFGSTAVACDGRFRYDASGNVQFDQHPDTRQHDDRLAYYGADERLRAVDARTQGSFALGSTAFAFEQDRYDAFGRRVWVRTDRRCDVGLFLSTAVACDVSTWRRTVWDGDRELAEIQVPIRYAGAATSVPDADVSTHPSGHVHKSMHRQN